MSDPYEEATQHERTGLSTLAKIFLVGGGLLVAAVIALAVWNNAWWKREMSRWAPPPPAPTSQADENPAALGELQAELEAKFAQVAAELAEEQRRFQVEAVEAELIEARTIAVERIEAVAEQESVAQKMFAAMATAAGGLLLDDELKVVPGDASGLSFEIEGLDRFSLTMGLTPISETLDKVGRGEIGFADVAQEESRARESRPEWVPIPPAAREHPGAAVIFTDIDRQGGVFGVEAFVAETSAADILDWYHDRADRMQQSQRIVYRTRDSQHEDAASASSGKVTVRHLRSVRGSQSARMPPRGDIARFAMQWDDRKVTVFATEDDHGDSLFVVLYRG